MRRQTIIQPLRSGRSAAAVLLGIMAIATLAIAFSVGPQPVDASPNASHPAVSASLARRKAQCDGEVIGRRDDGSVICTHGEDELPPAMRQRANLSPRDASQVVPCIGDGVSGNRLEVLYVHAPGNDQYASQVGNIRGWVAEMNVIFDRSAELTGGHRELRLVTDSSCQPVVRNVEVVGTALESFGESIRAVQAAGWNRDDRTYVMFVDSGRYCGIGTLWGDDTAAPSNANNSGGGYARVDRPCWGAVAAAHETMHTLGAVQRSAPHATANYHCTDENDIMCYSDSGGGRPAMDYVCTDGAWARLDLFDCNSDDYYSTNPAAGSYLDTHWNVANSSFLHDPGSGNVSPITSIEVSGPVSKVGATVTITIAGFPGNTGVTVRVDETAVATGVTGADGTKSFSVTMPATTRGEHQIAVTDGTHVATRAYTVTTSATVSGTVKAGKPITIVITGASAGESLTASVNGRTLGSVVADEHGSARMTVRLSRKSNDVRSDLRITGTNGATIANPVFSRGRK